MVGHYTIAGAACQLGPRTRNWRSRCVTTAIASPSVTSKSLPATGMKLGQRGAFVALADVPDLVWRRTRPKVRRQRLR